MPDFPFTKEEFLANIKHRRGTSNPERVHNPVWEWMVKNFEEQQWSHGLYEPLGLERDYDSPDWHYYRFGMSRTRMPDGRIICIAGEHEDYYDSDFCIYNDVLVLTPTDDNPMPNSEWGVKIFAYPTSIFSPTDFHSSVLVGNDIYIIGRLGYPEDRTYGQCPVYKLSTETMQIERVDTTGETPGYIHEHHASYDPGKNQIFVRGGNLDVGSKKDFENSTAIHSLDLETLEWCLLAASEQHRSFIVQISFPEYEGDDVTPDPTHAAFRPDSPKVIWMEPYLDPMGGIDRFYLNVEHVRIVMRDCVSCTKVWVQGELPESTLIETLDAIVQSHCDDTGDNRWSWKEIGPDHEEWEECSVC